MVREIERSKVKKDIKELKDQVEFLWEIVEDLVNEQVGDSRRDLVYRMEQRKYATDRP